MTGFKIKVRVNVKVETTVFNVLLFCKDRPEGLSEAALPQDANSFAESGRTGADTAVQSTDALQKSGFPPIFVKPLCLCVFLYSVRFYTDLKDF